MATTRKPYIPIRSIFSRSTMFKMQFLDSGFYVIYLILSIFSVVGLLIFNMYRQRREIKRLKEKLERVMKDESAVWAE